MRLTVVVSSVGRQLMVQNLDHQSESTDDNDPSTELQNCTSREEFSGIHNCTVSHTLALRDDPAPCVGAVRAAACADREMATGDVARPANTNVHTKLQPTRPESSKENHYASTTILASLASRRRESPTKLANLTLDTTVVRYKCAVHPRNTRTAQHQHMRIHKIINKTHTKLHVHARWS